jgi:hypothetical protein
LGPRTGLVPAARIASESDVGRANPGGPCAARAAAAEGESGEAGTGAGTGAEQQREQERVSELTRASENEAMSQATLAEPIGMAIEDLVVHSPLDVATPAPESPVSTSLLDTKKLCDPVCAPWSPRSWPVTSVVWRPVTTPRRSLLSSVVEAALLDHVLPRRNELGLKSSPRPGVPKGCSSSSWAISCRHGTMRW